ncbi:alpha/beta hydrolase [Marisediminicola sp. LYQ134]|uniref:alpha/beta hydrolase n=1 Tax=Marisediminicola sp. LYQ134 TaxID=3391061 RepID=UPI0039831CB0
MLIDVAAILVTSVALTGLTGVSGAPERPVSSVTGSRVLATADSTATATASPELARVTGSTLATVTARVDADVLPTLRGRMLLDQLTLMTSRDIEAFLEGEPAAVAALLDNQPSARSVATWWSIAPRSAQARLLQSAPEVVGNLDGVPPSVRDSANRRHLSESIDRVESLLDGLGRTERAEASQQLHMLRQIEMAIVPSSSGPDRDLLSVDTEWPGRAAVVVGDLESADYVSYMVPGMFFTTDRLIVDWTVIAEDLNTEQTAWIDRLSATDPALLGATAATVAWIGYETPGILDITSLDLAEEGAKRIGSAVDGLEVTRAGDEPFITLNTHSYGSTATLMALADGSVEADALVIIGSPGGAAQSVDDLGMSSDSVFVGEAAWDPVVHTAFFGSDPGSDSFGASSMNVGAQRDPVTGQATAAAFGHLGYFDAGSTAMRNMALVSIDRGDLVTDDRGETPVPGRREGSVRASG